MPKITVIIPAFNEQDNIAKTILSVLNAQYSNKQVIVVNDGSTDNTHRVICQTIKNTDIRYINLEKNRGKRIALYKAVQAATGQIIVTVDSDSIIEKNTLQEIVKPFTEDSLIGGVAGNILVSNKSTFIGKLLSSAFTFGFYFLRPAQSVSNCVLCTPGALSAYRKSAILSDLKTWSKAIFFGHRSNIGQDRALTTIILKRNYKVVYQNSAKCYTNVPDRFKNLINMFIRWIRGDLRQMFSICYFMRHIRSAWNFNIVALLVHLGIQVLWMITPFLLLYYLYLIIYESYLIEFCISVIVLTIFWSILPGYICYRTVNFRQCIYSVVYGFINVFFLFWIIPYCWLTIYQSGWLTRK